MEIYGSEDIVVERNSDDTYYIGLKKYLIDKLDTCVNLNDFFSLEGYLTNQIRGTISLCNSLEKEMKEEIEELKKENKELRHCIAHLNTRVNNLIAEKQLKEFYEKNNRECEVARC